MTTSKMQPGSRAPGEDADSFGLDPRVEIQRHFVFKTSLLSMQFEGPRPPPSAVPCNACKAKRVKCICESVKVIGKTAAYELPALDEAKARLQRSRMQLSSIPIDEWKRHTSKTDTLRKVLAAIKEEARDEEGREPELVINSWGKFYEILSKTGVLDLEKEVADGSRAKRVIKTIHLCECPGGFIAATNHFIKTRGGGTLHSWRASSLNPYFEGASPLEALDDDVLFRQTERRWVASPDGSGDLRSRVAIEALWKKLTRKSSHANAPPPFGLADLVTADGSFDVQHSPADQEVLVAPLVFAEAVAILGLTQRRGSAVLKTYGLSTHHSVSVLALFSMCFRRVAVVKPLMSRGGNSEVYVLGFDFRGTRSPLLLATCRAVDDFNPERAFIPRDWLPSAFIDEVVECARYFMEKQIEHIDRNLESVYRHHAIGESERELLYSTCERGPFVFSSFRCLRAKDLRAITLEQERVAAEFAKETGVLPIRFQDRLIQDDAFIWDWQTHGFTNSTRRGSRQRVQGLLEDRAAFREAYTRLQNLRMEHWTSHGNCSRSLVLLRPSAVAAALACSSHAPFEIVKKATGATHISLGVKRRKSDNKKDCENSLKFMSDFLLDAAEKTEEGAEENNAHLKVAHWLHVYSASEVEAPVKQKAEKTNSNTASTSNPTSSSRLRLEALDTASFFETFAAKGAAAASLWKGAEGAVSEEADKKSAEGETGFPACAPPDESLSAELLEWREEILRGIQRREFLQRPSTWLPLQTPLAAFKVQSSRFADERLMALLSEVRTQLPFLPPISTADCLYTECASPFATSLSPEELPPPSSVDLLFALRQLRPCGGGDPSVGIAEASAALWRQTYSTCVELSLRFRPLQLPLQLMLRRYGSACLVVLNCSEAESASLTRESLVSTIARSGPLLGVRTLDVDAAFRGGFSAQRFLQSFDELVATSKLPREGAPLVSLDVTGFEETRGTEAAFASAREMPVNADAVTFSHEEFAQAELESVVFLLAQLMQGLRVLSEGGDLVIRLHSVLTRATASLLQVTAVCFASAGLYRPPSVPAWCMDTFFLGRGKRSEEANAVASLLSAAWDSLCTAHFHSREEVEGNTSRDAKERHSSSSPSPALGPLDSVWSLSQFLSAKLFTTMKVASCVHTAQHWMIDFNNAVLTAQVRELRKTLEAMCSASLSASVAASSAARRAAIEAGLGLDVKSESRRAEVAVFLQKAGLLDLLLRGSSPLHALAEASANGEGGGAASSEWGHCVFDDVQTLAMLAGARPYEPPAVPSACAEA